MYIYIYVYMSFKPLAACLPGTRPGSHASINGHPEKWRLMILAGIFGGRLCHVNSTHQFSGLSDQLSLLHPHYLRYRDHK